MCAYNESQAWSLRRLLVPKLADARLRKITTCDYLGCFAPLRQDKNSSKLHDRAQTCVFQCSVCVLGQNQAIDFSPRLEAPPSGDAISHDMVSMNSFDDAEFDQYLPTGGSAGSQVRGASMPPPPPPYGPASTHGATATSTPTTWSTSSCRLSTTGASASGALQRMAAGGGAPANTSSTESPINLSPGSADLHSNTANIPSQASPNFHSNSSPSAASNEQQTAEAHNIHETVQAKMDAMAQQYQRDPRYNYELHMARYGYHSNVAHDASAADPSMDYPTAAQQYSYGAAIPGANPYQCMGIRTMYPMPNPLYHQ